MRFSAVILPDAPISAAISPDSEGSRTTVVGRQQRATNRSICRREAKRSAEDHPLGKPRALDTGEPPVGMRPPGTSSPSSTPTTAGMGGSWPMSLPGSLTIRTLTGWPTATRSVRRSRSGEMPAPAKTFPAPAPRLESGPDLLGGAAPLACPPLRREHAAQRGLRSLAADRRGRPWLLLLPRQADGAWQAPAYGRRPQREPPGDAEGGDAQ